VRQELWRAPPSPDPQVHPLGGYLDQIEAFLRRLPIRARAGGDCRVGGPRLPRRVARDQPDAVTSAEMRSGKTRTLDCLKLVCPRAFRLVSRPRPSDTPSSASDRAGQCSSARPLPPSARKRRSGYEELRAILDSGNRQRTPLLRVGMEVVRERPTSSTFSGRRPWRASAISPTPSPTDRFRSGSSDERSMSRRHGSVARRQCDADLFECDWDSVTLGTDVTVPDRAERSSGRLVGDAPSGRVGSLTRSSSSHNVLIVWPPSAGEQAAGWSAPLELSDRVASISGKK
jgi:hypothetical protein